jgi:hypothetical protein
MNFDNAIADTMYAHSDYVGNCRKGENTPDNEERWFVTFEERSVNGKEMLLEVILRDGGIVISILDWKHMTKTEARNITNTFTNYLTLV